MRKVRVAGSALFSGIHVFRLLLDGVSGEGPDGM
jgi:hypothetical protein